MNDTLQEAQKQFYLETADTYDEVHHAFDYEERRVAINYVSIFIHMLDAANVLDIGCGTGRSVKYLWERGVNITGIEPVKAMIEQAIMHNGVPAELLIEGSGLDLPFAAQSYDVVYEFGVLHHVKNPELMVSEMMRVARKAVFLSDENRFGMGSLPERLLKLLFCKTGLFKLSYYIKTLGKGYRYSEGDGVAFSYSVYDAYDQLVNWADRVFLIPVKPVSRSTWFHPLLNSSHILLCAIKDA